MPHVSARIRGFQARRRLHANLQKPSEKPRCLILMPYAPEYDDHYHLIQAAATSQGYEIHRVEKFEGTETITKQSILNMLRANIIIADLTDNNPNVLYEVGVAQTLRCKVLLVHDNPPKVPFDLAAYPVIKFPDPQLSHEPWEDLEAAISVMRRKESGGGPVEEVLGNVAFRLGQPLFSRRCLALLIDISVIFLIFGGVVGGGSSSSIFLKICNRILSPVLKPERLQKMQGKVL